MPNLEQLNREEANNYILNDFNLQDYQNIEVKLINIIAEKIRYFFFEKVNEYDQVIGQVKQNIKKYITDLPIEDVSNFLKNKDNLDKIVDQTFDKLKSIGEIINLHGVYWSPGQTRFIDLDEEYYLILSPIPTKQIENYYNCKIKQFAHIRYIHKSILTNISDEQKLIVNFKNWLGLENFSLESKCNEIISSLSKKMRDIDNQDYNFNLYSLKYNKYLRFQNIKSLKSIPLEKFYILKDDINLYYYTNSLNKFNYPKSYAQIEGSDLSYLITYKNSLNKIKAKYKIDKVANNIMVETPCLLPPSIFIFFSTGYTLSANKYEFYFDLIFLNFIKKLFSYINIELAYE